MFVQASVGFIHYGVFTLGVIFFLALDLGVFNRKARRISFKEALCWSSICFSLSMAFAFFAIPEFYSDDATSKKRLEFITGYILELSLSMDNVFVIALIFSYFKVKPEFQHRVLFWGILRNRDHSREHKAWRGTGSQWQTVSPSFRPDPETRASSLLFYTPKGIF